MILSNDSHKTNSSSRNSTILFFKQHFSEYRYKKINPAIFRLQGFLGAAERI